MACIQVRTENTQAKQNRMNPTLALYYWTSVCVLIPSVIGQINIALGKPASQSTTWPNTEASRANDGNRASKFGSGSCSHTEHERTNWWQVDLQGMYSIGSVFIVNRDSQVTDHRTVDSYTLITGECSVCVECTHPCKGYFLQDLEVHVFWEEPSPGLPNGTVCATHIPPMGVTATLQCEAPVIGRYLRIYRRSSETVGMPKLVFCEVEVYGRRVATCGVESLHGLQLRQANPLCELIYDISVIDRFEASAIGDFYELISE